jgi:hypothetical protein
MRKLLLALPLFLAMGCAQQEKAAEQTNGFGPYEGQSVYLGDEATVTVFKALDAAWAARDYTTMKDMIEDGGMFVFEDGDTVTTGQEFVDKIEADYQESLEKEVEWGWKID